jgi:peptide deformylase
MKFEIIPNQQTPCVFELVHDFETNTEILKVFLEFACSHHNAVGLAANQCSLDEQRFMQNIFALRNLKENSWKLIINPKIDKYFGMIEPKLEGCLTWVGKSILADRYRAINVSYDDIDGNHHTNQIYGGFEAQIWQHEVNHLNGIEENVVDYNYKLPAKKQIQRNDLCPCFSGKKYKNCCLIYLD